MLDINEFKNGTMYQALLELDKEMSKQNMPKCELNVVGGFALMTHKIRKETELTDIDYVGFEIPTQVKELSDKIGIKHNLGKDWINNDLMLTGTSLEDLEFSTGKLHFTPAFELENIKINILEQKDLLRMKIISIDTATTAVELGGDFTRMKDFPDILKLMETTNTSYEDIKTDPQLFGGDDFDQPSLIGDHTIAYIKAYEQSKEKGVNKLLLQHKYENVKNAIAFTDDLIDKESDSKHRPETTSGLSIMESFMQNAKIRYENEMKALESKKNKPSALDMLYAAIKKQESKDYDDFDDDFDEDLDGKS